LPCFAGTPNALWPCVAPTATPALPVALWRRARLNNRLCCVCLQPAAALLPSFVCRQPRGRGDGRAPVTTLAGSSLRPGIPGLGRPWTAPFSAQTRLRQTHPPSNWRGPWSRTSLPTLPTLLSVVHPYMAPTANTPFDQPPRVSPKRPCAPWNPWYSHCGRCRRPKSLA